MKKSTILAIGAGVSCPAALFTGGFLVGGDYVVSKSALYIDYAIFTVATILGMHFVAFIFPWALGIQPSRRVPRYLDYAYLLILALGLFEVAGFSSRYYLYLTSMWGTEDQIASRVLTLAESQIEESCGKKRDEMVGVAPAWESGYTEDYCTQLKKLAASPRNETDLLLFEADRRFMDHVVLRVATPAPPGGDADVSEFRNPITEHLEHLRWLKTFSSYLPDDQSDTRLRWIWLLLLPVGIGLRALKTSLELFGTVS